MEEKAQTSDLVEPLVPPSLSMSYLREAKALYVRPVDLHYSVPRL